MLNGTHDNTKKNLVNTYAVPNINDINFLNYQKNVVLSSDILPNEQTRQRPEFSNSDPNISDSSASSDSMESSMLSIKKNIDIINNYEYNKNKKIIDYSNRDKIITIDLNFDSILNSIVRLAKSNKEFYTLTILSISWFLLTIAEAAYGYAESLGVVISDSFFNFFKIFTFLIPALAIYLTRYLNYNIKLLYERMEILAAMSNIIFLMIVSIIMFVKSLHLVTEESEILHSSDDHGQDHEAFTISVFKFFYLVKVLLNIITLLLFSDYVIHPVLQMRIFIFKKYKKWLSLNTFTFQDLDENKQILKQWNNHFENMNCLNINILTDLTSSLIFLSFFYATNDKHFEYIYFVISLLNLIIVTLFVYYVSGNIINLLMQGKSEIIKPLDNILQKEIGMFEGCIGIKEAKYWMIANNKIMCN